MADIQMNTFSGGARAAVAEARSHLGYREGPRNNENFAGAHYGWNYVAWCVQFAWYCGDITGSGGGIPKTASTGAAMRWAKSVGRWRTTPQAGDWSIMVNSRGATIHTDLVESYRSGRLVAIGGNTSGTYKGSVNEGNGVYRNDRTSKWHRGRIVGFVRPLYGLSTEAVKFVQSTAGIKVDGKYGPATRAATKRLQARYGLTQDGFPGPKTVAALIGGKLEVIGNATDSGAAAGSVVEQVVEQVGRKLKVDGRFGSSTVKALQEYLNKFHGAGLKVDGKAGHSTWKALQKALGTPADGKVSNQSYRADELGNGITQGWDYDGRGASGSTMVKAMQGWIGVTRDGVWGSATTSALQRRLNEKLA